ncbi:MAG: hypothetical protein JSR18_14150 [Proteobacteria bacterium]|nr:hypothetical protein [Pseudomonadota bacterium]
MVRLTLLHGWTGIALRALFVAVAMMVATGASAQATTYVYSAVGRQMTVINAETFTTSAIDRRQRTTLFVANDELDGSVVADVTALARKATPPATVTRVTLEADATPVLEADTFVDITPDGWLDRLGRAAPYRTGDRLLVIAPARDDIRFSVGATTAGTGQAAGVGIYVAAGRDLLSPNPSSPGMLGFFANFRVLLLDPVARRVIAVQGWSGGVARSGQDAPGGNLWNAVGGKDKINVLRDALRAGLEQTVPSLLAR